MRALTALTSAEFRQHLRNPTSMFMALLLPTLLLLLQGFVIPGTTEALGPHGSSQSSMRAIDFLVPVAFAVAVTSAAITNYPAAIGAYRESGILRRLDATPAGAHRILFTQWIVSGASVIASVLLVAAVAGWAFGVAPPQQPWGVAAALAAGTISMMAVGSLIAAVAATAQIAYGMGLLVFMASLYTAGVWTPGPLMNTTVATVSGFTPAGAMTQGINDAWYGGGATVAPFLVLIGWSVLCALGAARIFRWR